MGKQALEEAERCLRDLKALGIKFQQPTQAFHLDDRRFYPLRLSKKSGGEVVGVAGRTGYNVSKGCFSRR
jgi:predicted TIM-barrel fold metal-dependent hydrolase